MPLLSDDKENDDVNPVNDTLTIDSAHVLRLIQAHLTECGLHDACRALQQESGVGGAGVTHHNFLSWAKAGNWGTILTSLSSIDSKYVHPQIMKDVHEITILELADAGQVELAYATLRLVQEELDANHNADATLNAKKVDGDILNIPKSRELEQRLAALTALRAGSLSKSVVPPDFYGEGSVTKMTRREEIGKRLSECIPFVPPSRLTSLLQQAIKWQAHTGQTPYIKRYYEDDNVEDDKKKKRRKKEFDLVLGEVSVGSNVVGNDSTAAESSMQEQDKIPSKVYSTIKFGKKATAECALFLPDGSGLVTGSSDGLVEVWDPAQRYTKLRMDLPYQEKDELMYHDDAVMALAISHDGTLLATGCASGKIKIWRVDTTGACLREFPKAHETTISCLCFSHDASKILSGSRDTLAREFGLRTSKMLKEFRGHASYVNTCHYVITNQQLLVVTGSADGTARIWDGKTTEMLRILRIPTSSNNALQPGLSSFSVNASAMDMTDVTNVHTVIPLHAPPDTFLVVPRGPRAFLLDYNGTLLKVYEDESGSKENYVAATASPSNDWLYCVTQAGACHVYNIRKGKLQTSIAKFGSESIKGGDKEISGLCHHPHKGIVGGFSNDKGQKRGVMTLWK